MRYLTIFLFLFSCGYNSKEYECKLKDGSGSILLRTNEFTVGVTFGSSVEESIYPKKETSDKIFIDVGNGFGQEWIFYKKTKKLKVILPKAREKVSIHQCERFN